MEDWIMTYYPEAENAIDDAWYDTSNYVWSDDDDDYSYSYLESRVYYDLDGAYLMIAYDSATDAVHSVAADYIPMDIAQSLCENLMLLLGEDMTGNEIQAMEDDIFDGNDLADKSGVYGNMNIFIFENNDGTLWLDISPENE
jgi:hypothetical protein